MPLRSLNRRSLVRQAVTLAPWLPLAACNPLSGAPPSTGATRDYSGVVLQYLGDGTDGASLKHHERAMQEFFAPDHPGARVEVVTVPGPSATVDKLQVLLAADTPPDGVGTDDYRVANLVQRGVLLDLTTYQETDRRYNAGDLYPGAWRAAHYRNRLYGLPIGMFGPVVVFNEDRFDKAGVPYPPADWRNTSWTWDRMRQDAQRLAERDSAGQLSRAGFAFDARFASRLSGHFAAYGAPLVVVTRRPSGASSTGCSAVCTAPQDPPDPRRRAGVPDGACPGRLTGWQLGMSRPPPVTALRATGWRTRRRRPAPAPPRREGGRQAHPGSPGTVHGCAGR
jgi:hypothetical protein